MLPLSEPPAPTKDSATTRAGPFARRVRIQHPTPTRQHLVLAHLQHSRCVPTTIPSAVRRSTLARCVQSGPAVGEIFHPKTLEWDLEIEFKSHAEAVKVTLGQQSANCYRFLKYRVSCTSVATARSSASRMESPSPSSSSARTLAASPGLSSTVVSTRRVSLKSVHPVPTFVSLCFWITWFVLGKVLGWL